MKKKLIATGFALGVLVGAWAEPVSSDLVVRAVNTLIVQNGQLECPIKGVVSSVRLCSATNGAAFYVAKLTGGGFVVMSPDTEIDPVVAISSAPDLVEDSQNPLWALLVCDMVKRQGSVVPKSRAGSHQPLAAASGGMSTSAAAARWARLTASGTDPRSAGGGARAGGGASTGKAKISDVRVAPLLKTKWGQSTDASGAKCFNYYTPNNYVCGCTATAAAQLLRYHKFPTEPVPQKTNKSTVDGKPVVLTMMGGVYDWDNMPYVPGRGTTTYQRQAIGKLTYDLSVAVNSEYSRWTTWGYFSCLINLCHRWGYAHASTYTLGDYYNNYDYYNDYYGDYYGGDEYSYEEELKSILIPNLDAKLPVGVRLDGRAGGHFVIADGYGYLDGLFSVHMNFGWDGKSDAWYVLPGIFSADYDIITHLFGNIYPQGPTAGGIVSGRVLSDSTSKPVPGVVVTARDSFGNELSATTDENGIYSLILSAEVEDEYDDWGDDDDDWWYGGGGGRASTAGKGSYYDDDDWDYMDYDWEYWQEEPPVRSYPKDWDIYIGNESSASYSRRIRDNENDYGLDFFVLIHTVTFDANGGMCTEASRAVMDGSAFGSLPETTRNGFAFDGWYTALAGGERIDVDDIPDRDLTCYAHWTRLESITSGVDFNATLEELGYEVPSGDEPYTFTLKGLPSGLKYDAKKGRLSGKVPTPGIYEVTVTAKGKSKATTVGTVTIKVANFTDGEIPVEDVYGPYIPGVEYKVQIPEAAGCSVSGLPSGMKWAAKDILKKGSTTEVETPENSVYGAATTPGFYTVFFTKTDANKVKHTATATFEVSASPVLTVVTTGNGTGKVTGAGAYAANKKVTLKATADAKDAAASGTKPATKKSVFQGWYDGLTLLSQSASFSYVMPDADVTLTAKFITAVEDAAGVSAVLDSAFSYDAETSENATSVPAGVYLEWPLEVTAQSQVSVAVSGLPSGLKFTAKDILMKGSKTEVEVPANTIYGTPTAASKTDKNTGNLIPSNVKIVIATAGKTKVEYRLALAVTPVEGWAVGTFDGGGEAGQLTLTVAATGKISGKYLTGGQTWTLSAANFCALDELTPLYSAELLAKSGSATATLTLGIGANDKMEGYGVAEIRDAGEAVLGQLHQTNWKVDPWKNAAKPFAKAAPYVYAAKDADGNAGEVTLKFASSGAIAAKGVFVTGKDLKGNDVKYTASGSATLIPVSVPDKETNAFLAKAYIYFPPKTGKFAGYMSVISLKWDGEKFERLE